MIIRKVFENGLRLLVEPMQGVHTASVGIYIEGGTSCERDEIWGISHFTEHMLFKGTKTRSARDIAIETDRLGGQINAYTAREYTCFYTRTVGEDLYRGFEILADMVKNSVFDEAGVDIERRVISEEIDMYEDAPEELAVDLLCAGIWEGSSLAIPILGTKESIGKITSGELRSYAARRYTPERIVITAAGDVDFGRLSEAVELAFGGDKPGSLPRGGEDIPYRPGFVCRFKDIEQNHIALALPCVPLGDEGSYPAAVLSCLFGGAMSSRLFQHVREKLGLCYSIYSFTAAHRGAGMLGIYAALSPDAQEKLCDILADELVSLRGGIGEEEFERAREQFRVGAIMGNDSPSARMGALAHGEMIYGRAVESEELLRRIDSMTLGDVERVCRAATDFSRLSMSIVGRCGEEDGELLKKMREKM